MGQKNWKFICVEKFNMTKKLKIYRRRLESKHNLCLKPLFKEFGTKLGLCRKISGLTSWRRGAGPCRHGTLSLTDRAKLPI